ncbi:MAG: hypothetical protein L3J46_06420, partial [Kangiellaceae bacterium]|nr:hypothetical protein [Kangiellaceae bacterium]
MNDQLAKIKHIAPVYLIAFTLTTLVLLAVRWLLSIRFEALNINEDIWEVWLPMFAPWLTVYLSIKSRIQILKFGKENSNGHFGFQMLALLSLVPVLFISQSLLTSATSKLTELDNVYQIIDTRKSRYYTVNDFHVANYYGGSFAFVRTGGRYNEDLDVTLYFAFPITLTEGEHLKPQPKYWYGVRYHKRINNRLSQSEKEEIYDRFYQKSLNKVDDYDFHDLTMLERLPTSEDRDYFLKAVKARTKLEPDSDTVILRPSKDNFEDLNGDKLEWIFYSFGIGITVFLLLLLVPGLDEEEYRRQLKGHKPEGDSFIEFASLLIPNKEYFVS